MPTKEQMLSEIQSTGTRVPSATTIEQIRMLYDKISQKCEPKDLVDRTIAGSSKMAALASHEAPIIPIKIDDTTAALAGATEENNIPEIATTDAAARATIDREMIHSHKVNPNSALEERIRQLVLEVMPKNPVPINPVPLNGVSTP